MSKRFSTALDIVANSPAVLLHDIIGAGEEIFVLLKDGAAWQLRQQLQDSGSRLTEDEYWIKPA